MPDFVILVHIKFLIQIPRQTPLLMYIHFWTYNLHSGNQRSAKVRPKKHDTVSILKETHHIKCLATTLPKFRALIQWTDPSRILWRDMQNESQYRRWYLAWKLEDPKSNPQNPHKGKNLLYSAVFAFLTFVLAYMYLRAHIVLQLPSN